MAMYITELLFTLSVIVNQNKSYSDFSPHRSTVSLVLFHSRRADVPVSAHRSTVLTVFYCDFPQTLQVAYRDISRMMPSVHVSIAL